MFYSSFSLLYFHFIGGWTRFLFRHDFAMQHNIFLAYAKKMRRASILASLKFKDRNMISYLSSSQRYFAVGEVPFIIFLGVPVAIISPPLLPPSGPMSII